MININLFIYETCACLTFFYYNQCIFKHRWNTHKRWAYMRRTNTEKRSYEINASNTNKKKLGMRQKKKPNESLGAERMERKNSPLKNRSVLSFEDTYWHTANVQMYFKGYKSDISNIWCSWSLSGIFQTTNVNIVSGHTSNFTNCQQIVGNIF